MKIVGLAGPALIVAGASAIRLCAEAWRASLGAAGIAHRVHRFGGECSPAEIQCVVAAAREASARAIIGAGGGKVLDTARAAASDLGLPVVNALSVIYTEAGAFLEYRVYGRNPELVLVDTAVIAQSPPRLLSAGMGDALATWFEAKTCVDGGVRNMRGGASSQSALRRPWSAWWRPTPCCRGWASSRPGWRPPTRSTTG
jgi:glycerol dehydrogenase